MKPLSLTQSKQSFTAARNACKMCNPLGAALAFSGIEGCVPLLHGSQGCSTYIRRYLISHFREPLDIASSNFGEQAAIFGGADNIKTALANVTRAYSPQVIGVATTCLSETIGDDVPGILREYLAGVPAAPRLLHASTPSYRGSHFDGYIAAVRATVQAIAEPGDTDPLTVNLIPGMLSPADLRHLRELVEAFGLSPIVLPDYSDRLDGATWQQYQPIPPGGTPLPRIARMGRSCATIELSDVAVDTAGAFLHQRFGISHHQLPLPVGLCATDLLCERLQQISGRPLPARLADERGRLVDSFIDAHKAIFHKRVIIYGDEDLVIGLTRLCAEIGASPVLCASGGNSGKLPLAIAQIAPDAVVLDDVDFEDIADAAADLQPDLLLGNSKGYSLARRLHIPLVRAGLPVHDRIGGSRLLHVGYRGAQQLFDRVVNALLERMQDQSEVGYTYLS